MLARVEFCLVGLGLCRLFGKDRSIGLVHAYRHCPAEKIIDAVLHAARTFSRCGPLQDDLTVVVAKAL